MIKARQFDKTNCSIPLKCDSCNRKMLPIIEYMIKADNSNDCETIGLCEDCANAMSNLFYKTMEEGKSFIYSKDEIKEINESEEK